MLAPGTVLQGRYRIQEHVGRGGMGTVYRATDLRLQSNVALKQRLQNDDPDDRDRDIKAFEREALLLYRLRHLSLPRVIDYFHEDNGQFLVMDYIDGDDFGKQLAQNPRRFATPAQLPMVLRYADELLDVLIYLHDQKPPVIHSDIKPQNLKLGPNGKVFLLDFGLSRGGRISVRQYVPEGQADTTQPPARMPSLGYTRPYAPLEQIRGRELTYAADLYAFAATVVHLLSGTAPPDPDDRQFAVFKGQGDPLLHMLSALRAPPYITDLLRHALELLPDARPASAQAMRQMLQGTRPVPPPKKEDEHPLPPRLIEMTPPQIEGVLIETLPTGSPVRSIATSATAQLIAAGCDDHSVGLWRFDGSFIRSLSGHTGKVLSMAFSADDRLLASGGDDCSVRVVRMATGRVQVLWPWPSTVESVVFSPDGQLLAAGGWADTVELWKLNSESIVPAMPLKSPFVLSLAFSPDGKWLAAGCFDGTVLIWERQGWRLVQTLRAFSTQVLSVAFSSNGQFLAAGSAPEARSGAILLWKVDGWRQQVTLRGHTAAVRSLIFRPEGSRPENPILISGSEDRSVRLWRVPDGRPVGDPLLHEDGVTCLSLSQDRQTLVSGSRDAMVRIWRLTRRNDRSTP